MDLFAEYTDIEFDLKPYKSLESLSCSPSWHNPSINLNDHPQLKELNFKISSSYDEDYHETRAELVSLVEQKEKLRRSDLAIYFGERLLSGEFNELDKEFGYEEESHSDQMEE